PALLLRVPTLLQQPRDRPNQRIERELLPGNSLRLLVRQLPLTFAEEGRADPGTGARVPPPVGVEALDQCFREESLKLPGAEVARGIEVRVDVDEGVGGAVAKAGRAR